MWYCTPTKWRLKGTHSIQPRKRVTPMLPRSLLRTWPAEVACQMWPRCCGDRLSDSCRCTLWNRKVSTRSRSRWQICCQSGSACPSPIPSCNRILWVTQGRAGFSGSQTKPSSLVKWSAGYRYLLVDNFVGQGGTLANLIGYVESKGGHAVAATVLTGKPHSAKLAPDDALIEALRDKHGRDLEDWWRERFGFGFDCLTRSEARYLENSPDAQAVRDRLIAAGLEGSSGPAEGSQGPIGPADGG